MKRASLAIIGLLAASSVALGTLTYLLIASRSQLQQCRHEKVALKDDLTRAVARGVTVETQLNLCREGSK